MHNKWIYYILILYFFISCKPEQQKVTTYKQVAPFIREKCAICHNTKQAGPFNLVTYADIKKYANKIRFAIESNYMPPWPADTNYTTFANQLTLSSQEKNLILDFIKNNCPIGDTIGIENKNIFNPIISRKPDLTVRFQKAISINGNGSDHFFIVKLPYQIDKDTFVQYVEFVPHQKKIAHHVNGHLLRYATDRKYNYFDGDTYVEEPVSDYIATYKKMGLIYTDKNSSVPQEILPALIPNTVYYLPGFLPLYYKKDIGGFLLPKHGVFFLNDIHYGPSDSTVLDSSYLNIYFAPKKPQRYVYEGQMGTHGMSKITPPLIIPPNSIKSYTTTLLVPQTISVLSVNPHLHLLGKSYIAFAVTPQRDTIRLIKINNWNFNWQYYYIYKHPVIIPQGSMIVAIATFDNTSANTHNPYFPPKTVKEGDGFHSMGTNDEMFQFFFQYMIYQTADDTIKISYPY